MYMELSHKGRSAQLDLINGLLARAEKTGLPLKIRAPSIFLLEHDVQLKPAFVVTFCIIVCVLSLFGLLFFGQPFVSLITVLCALSVTAGTIGYGALWNIPVNVLTVGVVLTGLLYTAAVCFSLCYHFSNCGTDKTPKQRMEYAFQSTLWPTIWSAAIPIVAFVPIVVTGSPIVDHLWRILVLQMAFTLSHYFLFLPPCLTLLVQNLPKCCDALQQLCDETCCICCDNEEDATSIYYIPTTGRTLDRYGRLGGKWGLITYVAHYLTGKAIKLLLGSI